MNTIVRDSYNAIPLHTLPESTRNQIRKIVHDVQNADKIDEHGGWEFGIQKLTRRRSRALNWDLYGFGRDPHTGQFLIVIQVREWTEGRRWNTVRKSYFLLGYNEDGTAFAHPVSANVVHAAIRRNDAPQAVIDAVQSWIFGGDYGRMIRQGDVALVPLKRRPVGTKGQRRRLAILEGSHELRANIIAEVDGKLYAKDPTMIHIPGTHSTVEGQGWYRIVVGRRARFWDFATPTID